MLCDCVQAGARIYAYKQKPEDTQTSGVWELGYCSVVIIAEWQEIYEYFLGISDIYPIKYAGKQVILPISRRLLLLVLLFNLQISRKAKNNTQLVS